MNFFIFICMLGLSSFAMDRSKDYKLPDKVPAEVQANNFRLVREDFAHFYNTYYKENLKANEIQVEDVNYYEMKNGYALIFQCKLPNGNSIQFGFHEGGKPLMNGGLGTKLVTCDVHPGFTYFTSTGGKINCKLLNELFVVDVPDNDNLIIGTKEKQVKVIAKSNDRFDLSLFVPENIRADNFRLVREDFAHLYEVAYQERLSADDIHIEMVEYAEYDRGYALFFTGKYANGDILEFIAATYPSLSEMFCTMEGYTYDIQSGLVFYAPYERGKHIGVNRFNGKLQIFCPEGLIMLGSDKGWWKER